jgi:hypothetical protein
MRATSTQTFYLKLALCNLGAAVIVTVTVLLICRFWN